jgi:hypothetical protein
MALSPFTTLLLALTLFFIVRAEETPDDDLTPALFLSSKTPYWPQQLGPREGLPDQCKLVHVNHLGEAMRCSVSYFEGRFRGGPPSAFRGTETTPVGDCATRH